MNDPNVGNDRTLVGFTHWGERRLPAVTLDSTERFLAALYLRRYVAWCARSGRHIQAQWAAELWRRVR